jgi:type III secretion protein U
MSGDTSEEKQFAASSKKLRKMREQGQFAQSRDLQSLISLLLGTIYVVVAFPFIKAALTSIFDEVFRMIREGVEPETFSVLLVAVRNIAMVSLPLFFVVFLGAAMSTGFMGGGLKFSVHPMLPKFEKINPAAGLKRIFGKKNLIDFVMNFAKMLALVGLLFSLQLVTWNTLVYLPIKQLGSYSTVAEMILIFIATILGAMLVLAVVDYMIQRSIFLNDAKMTKTERKNENKEQEGTPELKSRRKEIARENLERPTGLNLATFSIQHGPFMLAFRYVEGETTVPILVGKATNADGGAAMQKAMPRRVAKLKDPLAKKLHKTRLGLSVTKTEIHELASLMSKNGLY